MNENEEYKHYPVFYREIMQYAGDVVSLGSKKVVDCTLGGGGHTKMLLEKYKDINMICFEQDPQIAEIAQKRLEPFSSRFTIVKDNFANIGLYFKEDDEVSAIIYDFGISSWHLDEDTRGFSFRDSQPLDMRLSPDAKVTAGDIVNNFNEKDIADIIYKFGEERFSRRIASKICYMRQKQKIENAKQLSEIVTSAIPAKRRSRHIHPATRTFQALRIYVNNELEVIEKSLNSAYKYLAKGGIIMAITFHSLEDRIVKRIFKKLSIGCFCGDDVPICQCDRIPRVKLLTKKPLLPTDEELSENNRSRSAKLRICEKV